MCRRVTTATDQPANPTAQNLYDILCSSRLDRVHVRGQVKSPIDLLGDQIQSARTLTPISGCVSRVGRECQVKAGQCSDFSWFYYSLKHLCLYRE